MARKTRRAKLRLTDEKRNRLEQISNSRKGSLHKIKRAQALLHYVDSVQISRIQNMIGLRRSNIYKWIDTALATGPYAGLKVFYYRPFEPGITDEANAWVINIACAKPKDHGLAAELCTLQEMVKFSQKHTPAAGNNCLSTEVRVTFWRILTATAVKPHKIKYYLERRDSRCEQKMREVLMVHSEVNLQDDQEDNTLPALIAVSVDEKPGVQTIRNCAPDLPPRPGKYKSSGRDCKYVRLGTASILTALDLHEGTIIAQAHDLHRFQEFTELLQEFDAYYHPERTTRVVLDNHSAHVSKETIRYLASRLGRFVYVQIPKHGSWLNLIETALSKMARTFLKHIRVSDKQELKDRILKWIDQIYATPVVYRWKKFDLDIA